MAASNSSDSIFINDGDQSLDDIFDFDEQQGREKSWCTSSGNSSCCSLCRLSESMEADDGIEDSADAAANTGLDNLQPMESPHGHGLSSELVSMPVNASQVIAAPLFASIPHNNLNFSMPFTSNTMPNQPLKSCQGCTCSITSAMMPSFFGTCGECQCSPLVLPAKANFMTQFASKNNSFLSREERLSLQSLLFPASISRQPDLLTVMSEGPLFAILSFLDVKSLVSLHLVNTKMRVLASDDSAGWKNHCAMLWSGKVRVCRNARRLFERACAPIDNQEDVSSMNSNSSINDRKGAMEAYKASILEAKNNSELSEEDLCFDLARDASGVLWSFRFKESAGLDWTSWDPWWNNNSARKLVFMRNGSILQSYPQGRSPVVTTHNSTPLYDVFSERLVQRNGVDIIPPRIEMRWRFVSSCLDLPSRPDGAYIRITVGGRDVPTYVVRRSPNGNWGFIMESCWGLYASFELGAKNESESSTASNNTARRALRRTRTGSRWVNIGDEDEVIDENNDDDTRNERNVRRRPNPPPNMLVEDSAMNVTGISQWREALLYNIGAVTLPEGSNALNEFDAAWQNALLLR